MRPTIHVTNVTNTARAGLSRARPRRTLATNAWDNMKQGRWILLLLLALLMAAGVRGENIARIDRIQPQALEQQAGQRAGLFSERRFESGGASMRVIGNGAWRITPRPGVREPLLVFYHPYTARISVQEPPGATVRRQDIFSPDLDPRYSRRALVFPLSGDGPVHVKVEGARYPLRVAVEPGPAYAAADL